ncbi:MAG: ComEA family DNA-binding protein [Brevibacillus sp.]|nr:ComEA family DNA-binding protein [Brevibacillus sp.]
MLYEWWERYRRLLVVLVMILLAGIALHFYPERERQAASLPFASYVHATTLEESKQAAAISSETVTKGTATGAKTQVKDEDEAAKQQSQHMYVDVKGSVKHPGLYQFAENDRVQHVIEAAGGFLPAADTSRVNLAQPLVDGMVVWVPQKGDNSTPPLLPESCPCQSGTVQAGAGQSAALFSGQGTGGFSADGRVNLNRATLQQLMTLPGIGETRAQAIIAYREQHGPFTSPEQLKKVTGIGDKTYQELKDKIAAP